MDIRIATTGPLHFVGVYADIPADVAPFERVPALWADAGRDGTLDRVAALSRREPWGPVGIPTAGEGLACRYWLAACVSAGPEAPAEPEVPEAGEGRTGAGHLTLDVPAWAVLEAVGPMPTALQDVIETHRRTVTDAGHTPLEAPFLEEYDRGDTTAPDYRSWLWVPIAG